MKNFAVVSLFLSAFVLGGFTHWLAMRPLMNRLDNALAKEGWHSDIILELCDEQPDYENYLMECWVTEDDQGRGITYKSKMNKRMFDDYVKLKKELYGHGVYGM